MNPNLADKPLTVTEAAAFTGYSKAYIFKLVHLKKIPFYKPEGGRILFALDDLKAFCFRNRQASGYELQGRAEGILTGGEK